MFSTFSQFYTMSPSPQEPCSYPSPMLMNTTIFWLGTHINGFLVNDPIYLPKLPSDQSIISLPVGERRGLHLREVEELPQRHTAARPLMTVLPLHCTGALASLLHLPEWTPSAVSQPWTTYTWRLHLHQGLQLHLPQCTSPCKHLPFCEVVHRDSSTNPGNHTRPSVSPQMWYWPPSYAICSDLFPRVCPSSAQTRFRMCLCPNCPGHYSEHCEGPKMTKNVHCGTLPVSKALPPNPLTHCLTVPPTPTEKYESPNDW